MKQLVSILFIFIFNLNAFAQEVYEIDVLKNGELALEEANTRLGLAFDKQDIRYYTRLFIDMNRNPTNVECFDIAQSNSEHSRHWFFKGKLVKDGKVVCNSLFKMVKGTNDIDKTNSLIAFSDNSSAIKGNHIQTIITAETQRKAQ